MKLEASGNNALINKCTLTPFTLRKDAYGIRAQWHHCFQRV